ncbi:VCBS domain-containing protein, partial [Gilvimarinus algae]
MTDVAGESSNDTLDIQITDTVPVAQPESNSLGEDDASVSGTVSVISGADADSIGVQNNVSGSYGTFSIDANGVYTYVLDTTNSTVQALDDTETLTDTFSYTVTDADGDASTETVTITINGATDGVPVISIDDEDGAATASDNSVEEASANTITGDANVSAEAGVASVTVAGQDITGASSTPVVISGSYGTLTITGYDALTGDITYSYTEGNAAQSHSATNDNIIDQFAVVVTDVAGESSNDTLDIQIT